MKKIKFYKPLLLAIVGIFMILNVVSCEEDEVERTNQYSIENIGLAFETLTTYQYKEKFTSTTPSFNIDHSVYEFRIVDVKLDGVATPSDNYEIDIKTGVITIDNTSGSLAVGTYTFDIGVNNVNGVILVENALTMQVLENPLNFTISNTTFAVNFLENADVATVTYTDTSPSGNVLSGITYSLVNAPAGFSIDAATGVISKTSDAASGVHNISILINSNLGTKTFENVLQVTVADPPTIKYTNEDGTDLTNRTLQPWEVFTSEAPVIEGMDVASFEIILPTELEGFVVVNDDGSITVLENQMLPVGVYAIGVIVTNSSGITATFENLFTISVVFNWDETFIGYTISNDTAEVAYLDNVDLATVTFVDNSGVDGLLTDITFSLVDAPAGFSIDATTGVISKTLSEEGIHTISVTITSNLGATTFTDILTVTVDEPLFVWDDAFIGYTISNTTFETDSDTTIDVATVTFVDNSGVEGPLTNIIFSLVDAPTGFAIDATTGVISKTSDAAVGVHNISVTITSNLGATTFTDILVVTVNELIIVEPFSLQYVQADGVTNLTNVTLSPNTAYATIAPLLAGMVATGYDIILPAELTGLVAINGDGIISIVADQNLPTGVHQLGVAVTDGSTTETLNNAFTLTVAGASWVVAFSEDFNNATTTGVLPNEYNAALQSYKFNGSEVDFTVQHTDGKGDVFTAKISDPKIIDGNGDKTWPSAIDTGLVLELTMQPNWQEMRVSFNEGFGYADDRLDWLKRSFFSNHSLDATISNWNMIMDVDDASWSTESIWATISSDADLNQVPSKTVEITPGNDKIYLNWRIEKTVANATKGASLLIDSILVEVLTDFSSAVEE